MAKTPLRALRISDELWKGAQARAVACGETVSEVVRRALAEYVAAGASRSGQLDLEHQTQLLLAQGMAMQRFGYTADAACTYLRRLSQTSGATAEETAQRVIEDHDRALGSIFPQGG